MDRKPKPIKHLVQKNFLLHLPYRLQNREQRLMKVIISELDDKRDEEFIDFEFKTDDLVDILELQNDGQRYERIRKALSKLKEKVFIIPSGCSKDGAEVITSWLSKGRLYKNKNKVILQIDGELKPFLLDIQRKFTKYQLKEILSFRREYSIRFYEWFKEKEFKRSKDGSWYVRIPIREIRYKFGLSDKKGNPLKYKEWRDFRKYVIKPSVEEISEKSQYIVSWEADAKRNMKDIIFHISPKQDKPLPRPKQIYKDDLNNEVDKKEKIYKYLEKLLSKCSDEIKEEFKEAEESILEEYINSNPLFSIDFIKEQSRKMAFNVLGSKIEACAKKK